MNKKLLYASLICTILAMIASFVMVGYGWNDIHNVIGTGTTLETQVEVTKKRVLIGGGCIAGTFVMIAGLSFAGIRRRKRF